MANRILAGLVLTAIGQLAAGRPFRAARTGKNGSFSVPPARLPPEQHGSFHSLPNPANPPLNTLKVAHGMCVQHCVEYAARNQIQLRLPLPQGREGGRVCMCVRGWCGGVGVGVDVYYSHYPSFFRASCLSGNQIPTWLWRGHSCPFALQYSCVLRRLLLMD